jgi:branched-chain amino acid transport system substrate-binding protein
MCVLALAVMLAFALAVLTAGCGSSDTTTTAQSSSPTDSQAPATTSGAGPSQTLKIGMITSVSGPMAPGFKNLADAAKPVADYINSKGGITAGGQQYSVEIVVEDDMSSPDGAVAAANKLIGEGITIIIAPQFTPNNSAIASICEQAKVLRLVVHGADTAPYSPPNKYCFGVGTTLLGIGPMDEKIMSLYPQMKKVAIIAPDDPGLQATADMVEADLTARGLETVYRDAYPLDTQDFNPILTKALAAKPDGIELVAGTPPWAKSLVEGARQMGFTGPIFATAAVGDAEVVSGMLDPKYGVDFMEQMIAVKSDKNVPEVQEFAKVVEAAGLQFVVDHINALQAVWVLQQGIEKAGSLDIDAVTAAMESADSFNTIYGQGRFVGTEAIGPVNLGQNRLMLAPVPFSRMMGGTIEFEWLPAATK